MNQLIKQAAKLIELSMKSNENQHYISVVEHQLIEQITFAKTEELIQLLDWADSEYWLEFPLWARLIAYRLLALLQPSDTQLLQRIVIGLRSFGPDWDVYADEIESKG